MKTNLYILATCLLFFACLSVWLEVLVNSKLAHTAGKEKETLLLQKTAKLDNQKTDTLLRKLAQQDKSELLATLQKIRPVIALTHPTGKEISITDQILLGNKLVIKPVVDSILQAEFPNEFRYEIASHQGTIYEGVYSTHSWKGYSDRIEFPREYYTQRYLCGVSIEVKKMFRLNSKGKRVAIESLNTFAFPLHMIF